jgi:hypothetical protein
MRETVLLVLVLISGAVSAEVGWRDRDGNPVPDTDSQKSIEGFGGLLVVTPDEDWEEKWNTPTEGAEFSHTSAVARGGKLFILTMFTNPRVDDSGAAHLTLDIDVKRPDGSSSTHAEDAVCFQGTFSGPPHNVYLCGPVIGFVGEPSDPAGTWSVQITLTDMNRKVSMPLATRFELLRDAD